MHTERTGDIIIVMIEKMTIDDLALMVQKGFQEVGNDVQRLENQMATKEDIQRLEEQVIATKEDLQVFREESNVRFDHLDARAGRIEADIHELQEGVVYRHEFEDVLGRIKYIERKLGIESGVDL